METPIAMLLLLLACSCIFAASSTSDAPASSCLQQDFTVRPIGPSHAYAYAAEVHGLQLESITEQQFQLVQHHLNTYPVLVFRQQEALSIEGQRAFSRRFGVLQVHVEATAHLPGYDDVNVISNLKGNNNEPIGLYGDHVENFHADLSWSAIPSIVTMLKSEVLPIEGGDTHFSHSVAAYEALPEDLKAQIANLTGIYSYLKYRADVLKDIASEEVRQQLQQGSEHPLVTMHPGTGKRSLLANKAHLQHIVGMDEEASQQLCERLWEQIELPQFRYVHVWQAYDLLLWDNRAVQHKASASPSSPRKLIRTTVLNEAAPEALVEELLVPPLGPCSENTAAQAEL